MSIASATPAQSLALRDNLIKTLGYVQQLGQGTVTGPSLDAAQVLAINAQLALLKVALTAVTG